VVSAAVLAGSFDKRRFLDGGFHDVLGQLAAFSTLRGNTQLFANFLERAGSAIDEFLDLTVGYSFAETDIHLCGFLNKILN